MQNLTFKIARDLINQMGCTLTRIDVNQWRVNYKGAHESAASHTESLLAAVQEAARRNVERMSTIANTIRK